MKIKIYCEHCGKLMATFDAKQDVDVSWAERPCGDKVCDECCDACAREFDSYHKCQYRENGKRFIFPCIMPEMPYCPACEYGLIIQDENDPTDCEWECLYGESDCYASD